MPKMHGARTVATRRCFDAFVFIAPVSTADGSRPPPPPHCFPGLLLRPFLMLRRISVNGVFYHRCRNVRRGRSICVESHSAIEEEAACVAPDTVDCRTWLSWLCQRADFSPQLSP